MLSLGMKILQHYIVAVTSSGKMIMLKGYCINNLSLIFLMFSVLNKSLYDVLFGCAIFIFIQYKSFTRILFNLPGPTTFSVSIRSSFLFVPE